MFQSSIHLLSDELRTRDTAWVSWHTGCTSERDLIPYRSTLVSGWPGEKERFPLPLLIRRWNPYRATRV